VVCRHCRSAVLKLGVATPIRVTKFNLSFSYQLKFYLTDTNLNFFSFFSMLIKTTNKFSLSVVIIFLLKQHFNINKTSVTVLRWVLKVETWKCFFYGNFCCFFLFRSKQLRRSNFKRSKLEIIVLQHDQEAKSLILNFNLLKFKRSKVFFRRSKLFKQHLRFWSPEKSVCHKCNHKIQSF